MRRFTRLTKGFSKKVQNHMYTFALHFICCNFVKVHQQVIPAIAAGHTDRLWDNNDLSAIAAANEPVPKNADPIRNGQFDCQLIFTRVQVKFLCVILGVLSLLKW